MTDESGKERLSEIGNDLNNVTEDLQIARGFVGLIGTIEKLSGIAEPVYDKSRGRYSAVSGGRSIAELEILFESFFGPPKKRSENPLPNKLRSHPIMKYLEGEVERQSLFFKKSQNGLFFGGLEPLAEPYGAVKIRLGFARKKAPPRPEGEGSLEADDIGLPMKSMEERIAEELGEGGGTVNGVGLATFLLEAEIEQSSCSLHVTAKDRSGYLFIKNGKIIDAAAGKLEGREAAVEVISWTGAEISVENPVQRDEDTIGQPLVRTLAAALKKRKPRKKAATAERKTAEPSRPPEAGEASPAGGAGKKGKKRRKGKSRIRPLHAAAAAAVLLLAAGGFFGFKMWKEAQREKAFAAVTAAAKAETDTQKAVSLLQAFVQAGPEDAYTGRVRDRIEKIQSEEERRLFARLAAEVEALPMGPGFEKTAEGIYRRYLERYPKGRFAKQVENRIASLSGQVEEHFYRQVTESEALDAKGKVAAYRQYLENVPDGAHRSQVQKRIDALVYDRLRDLEMEVRRCEGQAERQRCIRLCDEFLASFPGASAAGTVSEWRQKLLNAQDRADLQALAEKLARQPEKMRQALERFIEERSASPAAEEARQRLASLDIRTEQRLQWERVEAVGRDAKRPLSERLDAVRRYLAETRINTYRKAALSLKSDLEEALAVQERRRREAAAEKLRKERLQRQQARQEHERLRLERLARTVEAKLAASEGRFVPGGDGTFVDSRTGLVWCLLDSSRVLEGCHDYATARKYVAQLDTGNFRDWRLPTASELAGIYLNRPFFPDGDVPWYWTSRAFTTGYHEKVRVVVPGAQGKLSPEYRRATECGAVRAVRNPG